MKTLIAIVMFLFGVFVGILVMPLFSEFSNSMYLEEEYSTPRIKTILRGFGVTLPPNAEDINLFLKQDGEKKQMWAKFVCSPEDKDAFIANLNSRHSGLFSHEVESPVMIDGTPITWWTFNTSLKYYEFSGMCVTYDEMLHNLCLYAVSDGNEQTHFFPAGNDPD